MGKQTCGVWSVEEIGDAAGRVWEFLREHGRASLSAIFDALDLPERQGCAAVGWLAREGKLQFERERQATYVSLV